MKFDPALARPRETGTSGGTQYSVYGTGQPVVLIHGVGMNQAVWAPQVATLANEWCVIVYDMLGHGGSVLPSPIPTLSEYAAQLAHLLDDLRIEAAHIVGHSMGALVALEFALTYPGRTVSVAALNAVYDRTLDQRAAVMRRAATLSDAGSAMTVAATIARWFGDPVPAHLAAPADLVRALLASVDPVGYARTYQLFASSDQAHVGRLPRLTVPALFLTGECDPNSSPAMSYAMAEAVPHACAETVPNERHMMNLTAPDVVNQRLVTFIRAAANSAAPRRQGACHHG